MVSKQTFTENLKFKKRDYHFQTEVVNKSKKSCARTKSDLQSLLLACRRCHMSPIYCKSTLAWLPSEESAVVCLGFAQTEGVGLSPLLHLN